MSTFTVDNIPNLTVPVRELIRKVIAEYVVQCEKGGLDADPVVAVLPLMAEGLSTLSEDDAHLLGSFLNNPVGALMFCAATDSALCEAGFGEIPSAKA